MARAASACGIVDLAMRKRLTQGIAEHAFQAQDSAVAGAQHLRFVSGQAVALQPKQQ